MGSIPVFFCEETSRVEMRLRRYETGTCPGPAQSYHNGESDVVATVSAEPRTGIGGDPKERWAGDERWPAKCDHCDHRFSEAAEAMVTATRVMRRIDTGEEFSGTRDLPPGAVWDEWWFAGRAVRCGADGRSLVCKLPTGHDWMIDGPANNCGSPDDKVHKCWVRHGRPEDGTLHVDKNGVTCSAGAGSIAVPGYHGFLHNGHLVEC